MQNELNNNGFVCITIIKIFLRFIQEKSQGLFVHSVYAAFISQLIASLMNLNSHDIKNIYTAALLHDLGKVFLPNNILLKDTILSDHEFEILKLHPVVGAKILDSEGIFDEISKIILHHHEIPDGSGYPSGLKTNDIPLNSKILALADKYATLSEKRIYRHSLSYVDFLSILIDYIEIAFCDDKDLVISTVMSINDNAYLNLAIRSTNNYDIIFSTYFNFRKVLKETYLELGNTG